MKAKIKTIDIQIKEWFDKVNGNSYFAGEVTVNYGLKSQQSFNMPFQYGYDRAGEQKAFELLKSKNIINSSNHMDLKENKIIIRSNKITGCKKAELKEYN